VIANKKARYQYEVVKSYEAGIVLKGSEVKSIRDGRVNFVDSFAQIKRGEIFLYNLHIAPYPFDNSPGYNPRRERKLLFHKNEIEKLTGTSAQKGLTLIPLSIYFKKGRAKVEIGLAKGKRLYDKRRKLREKAVEQEVKRTLKDKLR
jgi:SsrA-binding protein